MKTNFLHNYYGTPQYAFIKRKDWETAKALVQEIYDRIDLLENVGCTESDKAIYDLKLFELDRLKKIIER